MNAIILPTEEINAKIGIYDKKMFFIPDNLQALKYDTTITLYHIYVLSEEEIKYSDYLINTITNKILKSNRDKFNGMMKSAYKKIIFSTDKSLDLEEPTQDFIERYINHGK